jgi:type III secretion system YscQ/HrcQ family protein
MASVRPFTFTNLKRMTRTEVALEASALSYFAGRPLAPDFAEGLAALLSRYLKEPCKLTPPEVTSVARRDVATLLPSVACLAVMGAAPGARKIIVDIDMALAAFAIERLLGGSGEGDRILRALTDIEEGVLSFLLLKVLSFFHGGLKGGRELALSLDRFASKVDEIQSCIEAETDFVVVGVRLAAGKCVGYVRILLPGCLVSERFGQPVPQSGASPAEREYMARRIDAIGDTPVLGHVELAALPDLSADDVANLEVGDIVVLENHQVRKTAEGLEGLVLIKLGAGKNGGLRCRLLAGEQQRVEVVEIVKQEQPEESVMAEGPAEGAAGAENLAETEGLLRDVAAPLVVELGRIRLSAAQVVRLRQGQVLRLPRGPHDPVDLVINGKVFAKGELIEVDGELGVRLVQVVGAP